jgi:endonuclease YncB( thermonuclease family)
MLAIALPAAKQSSEITGPASVTEADTIRVVGFAMRLQGVAAPERYGVDGPAATAFLRQLVEGAT